VGFIKGLAATALALGIMYAGVTTAGASPVTAVTSIAGSYVFHAKYQEDGKTYRETNPFTVRSNGKWIVTEGKKTIAHGTWKRSKARYTFTQKGEGECVLTAFHSSTGLNTKTKPGAATCPGDGATGTWYATLDAPANP
jgi:hypothetical protein